MNAIDLIGIGVCIGVGFILTKVIFDSLSEVILTVRTKLSWNKLKRTRLLPLIERGILQWEGGEMDVFGFTNFGRELIHKEMKKHPEVLMYAASNQNIKIINHLYQTGKYAMKVHQGEKKEEKVIERPDFKRTDT